MPRKFPGLPPAADVNLIRAVCHPVPLSVPGEGREGRGIQESYAL